MARQYRTGATVRQVADAFGKSYGFTYDRLREARVTMRRRGRPTPLP
jgi:transposase